MTKHVLSLTPRFSGVLPASAKGLTVLTVSGLALSLVMVAVSAADTAPGITEPFNDVTVSASVPGTLVKIQVKEGDFVEEGRAIMDFEKRQEELEVQRRKLIWEGKAEVTAAAAQMELLKIDLDGTKRLFETTKSVSKEQLLKKELEYKQAVAEFDKLTLTETREELEYQMALEQLRKRQITSPLAGYITELFRKAGEDCKAQEPLVRIVDTRRCYFVGNLEAKAAVGLRPGQPMKVEINNGKEVVIFTGAISFISPVVDPASGLLKIKVLFENPDNKIRPGVAGLLHLP
jgi:RND family efflux transporter MFP subunit